jgi:outer membrane biosynthesis protein TonB
MLGKDKRAGLSSNLLGAKDQPAATDEVAARAQRLLKRVAAARQPAETPAEEKAPAETRQEVVEEAAPAAVSPEPAKAAGEPESADLQETVLYRKGAASASGFRPWYWSYERDNAAPPPDGGAAVMPFPLNPPHAANPAPAPAAPAAAEASDEDAEPAAAAVTVSHRQLMLFGGIGAAVLLVAIGIGGYFLFAGHGGDAAQPQVAVTVAPAEAPKPAPAPQARVAEAPKPVETARPTEPPKAVEPKREAKVEAPAPAPVPAEPAPAPAPLASSEELATLIARGDQLLATGDIAAARVFYERAAEDGSAAAATAAGKTYDPIYLEEMHARGIRGDASKAAEWYRRASAAGDIQADIRLKKLLTKTAR